MNPLLLILLLPILEIVGFIQVGDWIGAGPTIGLLALSAVVGVLLVRHRGLSSLTRAQAAAARGEAPIGTVLDGFCAVLAGILLIIPGFLTDMLGLALLIGPLRRGIGRWLLGRIGAGMPVFTTMGGTDAGGSSGFGGGFGREGFGEPGFGASDSRRADDPFRPAPGVIDVDYRDVTPGDGNGDGKAEGDAPRLTDSQWGKHRPDERR
ncbi:exclusion protein FxsA [Azospirillum humicireducens]|uniref:Exclusion protein FxsA n=1 Tax=Azospirillum humicireducens TaxID=1226968 RepID=A0A160JHN6_9PROT|nr:FxsA family protein [Azospirillum humicireducens]ANC92592.1 exclusion protein FxsA [Azospirillum humicireducens]